jgi:ribosomal protein S18 acetylase RimI-like enzyme
MTEATEAVAVVPTYHSVFKDPAPLPYNINGIIYENYPYTNGARKDEKLNKGIISLAKRHKFYIPQINYVLGGGFGFSFARRQAFQVVVAKKKNKTNNNYQVVGFIIYDFGQGSWANRGSFCLASIEYWLVDKKFQGQGIGRTLYDYAEKDCASCAGANLKVMFDKTDARLCDLYTKLGYKLIKKYDGKEVENKEADKHIIWFKVNVEVFVYPEDRGGNVVVYESEVAD